ncbi:MAG: ATP-binding protein [Deltaproteobacteria bacterium]|nr:ATP-binding protein [Deltaproteobacteria bacterium]MBI4224142.1 ATP-binding protein [Deltaproteobacteria bacterium]
MLDNSILTHILNHWSYWDKRPPRTILRRLLTEQGPPLSPDLVLVIQGVRRCGKSTLLGQIMEQKRLEPAQCAFINFEDPRLSEDLDYKLLDRIVEMVKEKQEANRPYYFFLDEIQEVKNWQKWFHMKLERPGRDVFVITGSNATLLSGELATTLTGRHRTLEMFPFDFKEYKTVKPQNSLENFLDEGGFPRALLDSKPQELLREYFTDIIERDVRRHVSVRNSAALTRLVKAVFEACGSEISQRSLAGMLGVTTDTAGVYLSACEKAYLILPCPYFTFSERQRTARNRKFYPVDLGLRNAIATRTGFDKGKKLETAVFHHLRKNQREVFYWRQKGEVDLVVHDSGEIVPYQVSWEEMQERHKRALEEFYEAFPRARPAVFISRKNAEEFLLG